MKSTEEEMKEKIIKELIEVTEINTRTLLDILREKYQYQSPRMVCKRLKSLEADGIIIRSKYKGPGFERLIQLRPVVRDKEKDVKDFERDLNLTLKEIESNVIKNKLKEEKDWNVINETLNIIKEDFWSQLLFYNVIESDSVRNYVFNNYCRCIKDFQTKLSKMLWQRGFFGSKEISDKNIVAWEDYYRKHQKEWEQKAAELKNKRYPRIEIKASKRVIRK